MKDDKIEPLITKKKDTSIFEEIFNKDNIDKGDSNKQFKSEFSNNQGLLKHLNVDKKQGLDANNKKDLAERAKKYGTNIRHEKEAKTIWEHAVDCLGDPILQILLAAAGVSLIIGIIQEGLSTGWIEGSAIFAAVVIVVSITAFNNWSKDEQFRNLDKESQKTKIFVRRNGKKVEMGNFDILVGDILELKIGDIIKADCVLLEGELEIDESAMTGESHAVTLTPEIVYKDDHFTTPFAKSGTKVTGGSGWALVVNVGEHTMEYREIIATMDTQGDEDANKTPLEHQLDTLTELINQLGVFVSIFIGISMVLKEVIIRLTSDQSIFTSSMLDVFVNAFIISVTVIVVAIPEGLPMAVAISLAFSVDKMKKENNLVRTLESSETMGNCTDICTDKTGTLTTGDMNVSHAYLFDKSYDKTEFKNLTKDQKQRLSDVISFNVSSTWDEVKKVPTGNNMTENGLVRFIMNINHTDYQFNTGTPEFLLPFNSTHKMMISVYKNKNDDDHMMYVKGAPDVLMEYCKGYYNKDGKYEELDPEADKKFVKIQKEYAAQAERTFICASTPLKDMDLAEALEEYSNTGFDFFEALLQKEIVITCLLGIADLPKTDVNASIKSCHKAGLTVRMVTGDNIDTAIAIARKVNILTEAEAQRALEEKELFENPTKSTGKFSNEFQKTAQDLISPYAILGTDLDTLSGGFHEEPEKNDDGTDKKDDKGEPIMVKKLTNREKFRNLVKNLYIVARASPTDKHDLVLGLKDIGKVVAVTGDGTNDAPALKSSHVGFAMNIRGTDIAKEASNIILLDDSFGSIVTAIKYGRNVYDCIRKFLQFQLTTNIVAVFMTLLGGIILKDSPLNAIQMLWVNLIMDSFASLALATESPTDKLLERKPYKKDDKIITSMMLINVVTQSIFQIVMLIVILFYGDVMFGVPSDRDLSHFVWNNYNGYHFTIFFNIFVFMQVFNSINARKLNKKEFNVFSGIFSNSLYLIVQGGIVLGQILIVTFGGRAVRVHPLTVHQHLACALLASLSLVFCYIVKLMPFDDGEPVAVYKDGSGIRTSPTTPAKSVRGNRSKSVINSGPKRLSVLPAK